MEGLPLRIGKRPRCDARQRKRSPGEEVAEDVDGGKDKGHNEILEQLRGGGGGGRVEKCGLELFLI